MLIYHPAFDAYHCTVRMMALAQQIPMLDFEKARILDFYLAFPGVAASLRLPPAMTSVRRIFQSKKNVYRDPINPKATFMEMRQVQEAALGCLAAADLIARRDFQSRVVKRSEVRLPDTFAAAIKEFSENEADVIQALVANVASIPTAGPHGLKDRSGLLEYRYDAI